MTEHFLITGCAGFIGSHITRKLLQEKVKVTGVDNLSTGSRENLKDIINNFQFIEGDLCEPAVCETACQGISRIIHLASIPSVPRSLKDPLSSLHSSVTATVTLFEAARKQGVKRVVQAASSSAYGDSRELPKQEGLPLRPLSPYAAAKAAQELYGLAYAASLGLDTASLRFFNVFGPGQNPDSQYAAVIPKFITLMLENQPPMIYGDGETSRDFTYIDNVVHGCLLAARHPKPLRGETLNLACGERISLNELVQTINQELGKNIKPAYAPERAGDVRHSQADITRISEILSYRPQLFFREGLKKTIAWYAGKKAIRAY